MAKFFDLPLEIRNQIYRFLIDADQSFLFGSTENLIKLRNIHSSILQVNKTVSQEAGLTFYKDNPVEIWVVVDYDNRDTIDLLLDTALGALFDEDAVPCSWQCGVTVHVSYGLNESEFYHSRLILHEKQAKYPSLSGAPLGKDVLDGWRQWFSGGSWRIGSFYLSKLRGHAGKEDPMRALCTKRGKSWKVGTVISGDDFVKYLERLLPSP